jgi:DNA-binding beta-propeller fold protein YncE
MVADESQECRAVRATAAGLKLPCAVAADALGNRFIADTAHHAIRVTDAAGSLRTLAGAPGVAGHCDGQGASARFCFPAGLAADGIGGVFVADTFNHTIRHVDVGGVVRTLAGCPNETGVPGAAVDEPIRASAARFEFPSGLAFDGRDLYIADTGNHAVRRVCADGSVTLHAGSSNGTAGPTALWATRVAARWHLPVGLAFGRAGSLWVVSARHGLRVIHGGHVLAGIDTIGVLASIEAPLAIAFDAAGGGLVAAAENRLLRVSDPMYCPSLRAIGTCDHVGHAAGLCLGHAHSVVSAGGLAFDAVRGTYLVADRGNNRIREIDPVA